MIDEALNDFYAQTGRMPVKALIGQSIWHEALMEVAGKTIPMYVLDKNSKELGYLYKNVHFILIVDRPDEKLLRLL